MRVLHAMLATLAVVPPLLAAEAPEQVRGATTVGLVQALHLHYHGALFIDVRSDDHWRWGHIAGALHLPLAHEFGELEDPSIPRELPLVIYCDSELCASAPRAVERAVGWGYRQVFYFREGYFAWQLADLPLGKAQASPPVPLSARAR